MTADVLLPCPHCGGPAESDDRQWFHNEKGNGNQCAVYCLKCNAHMTLCWADTPAMDADERMAVLRENWNRRASAPRTQPAQDGEVNLAEMHAEATIHKIRSALQPAQISDVKLAEDFLLIAAIIGPNPHAREALDRIRDAVPQPAQVEGVGELLKECEAAASDLMINPNDAEGKNIKAQGRLKSSLANLRAALSQNQSRPVGEVDTPTEKGVYIWQSGNDMALVHVHKRPTRACHEGGPLKGSVIARQDFYDGCRVEDWGRGTWTRIDCPAAPIAPTPSPDTQTEKKS